jgi:5-methylcytosine-specific restriction enzyme subunit McrC
MTADSHRIIELTEYKPCRFPLEEIPYEIGKGLLTQYKNQVSVEFPTPVTDDQWQLTCQGWAGFIPVTDSVAIRLVPKVEVDNIFGMLEYAYATRISFPEGLFGCQSLEDFYERLAHYLSLCVLRRGRKGYYRNYVTRHDNLPYLCGRLDVLTKLRKPWAIAFDCDYHEHTSDLEENQILCWTLGTIAMSGLCSDRVMPIVKKAFRELHNISSMKPFGPRDCVGRLYNRLNDDYHPLHALCRFFLEHTGPTLGSGDKTMVPFLVNMERLFELFVAQWLKKHLPSGYYLTLQEEVLIGPQGGLHFDIDLVLYEVSSGQPLCVLDTKYKTPEAPSASDIAQVAAYAHSKGCKTAFLVYPAAVLRNNRAQVGDIEIRCLTFSLQGDLEIAGKTFMQGALSSRTC